MSSSERFSKRHGYRRRDAEIRVREDAPSSMRSAMLQIAIEVGPQPWQLREILCRVLRVAPNPNNWSEYPNILYKCFLWGLGLQVAGQQLQQLAPNSLGTTFGISFPK